MELYQCNSNMVPILMQTCKRVAFYHPRTKNKVTGFQGKLLLLIRIHVHVRLSIKIILFPVDQPGGSKRCDWRLFHFCRIFLIFFLQKWTIFSWKTKKSGEKNKFAAARLASILATRCTGNRIFFMDRLIAILQY